MWLVDAFLAHWFLYSLAGVVVLFLLRGIRYIPNTKVGLVEKRTSGKGSVSTGIIALNGEAGFQPALLRGGVHYLLPGQYKIHIHPLVTIPQGKIGYVFARDGVPLPPTQALASHAVADDLQDAAAFLQNGGQRGPQRKILREGTYAINRLFATVEMVPKTVIEVGNVGVVVSYTGETGEDLSGAAYKHGELVQKGLRGVWSEPLLPGKYAFNTYAGKVFLVPTTNFILKWNKQETGSHKYDENLAEVALITKDAFEPSLPLSVVVHIDYRKAPLVIQRFGDLKRLVEQTLDPMVSAYFKNVGQTRTLIQLLQDRSAIQQLSGDQMKEKFDQYNLELQEVLIGTPTSGQGGGQIEQILTQLRSRQIAEEQVETYNRQEKAAVKERELREAEARAKQQTTLTESELYIAIQTNQGKADYARAQQQAAQIQTLAQAEAEKIRILGEGEAKKVQALAGAEAERAARVGIAQAMAIDEQVRAYGGPRFQLTQQVMSRFAEAIEAARVDVVPKIMIHGGGANGTSSTGSVMEALLTLLLADRMGADATPNPATPRSAAAEAVRSRIEQGLKEQR